MNSERVFNKFISTWRHMTATLRCYQKNWRDLKWLSLLVVVNLYLKKFQEKYKMEGIALSWALSIPRVNFMNWVISLTLSGHIHILRINKQHNLLNFGTSAFSLATNSFNETIYFQTNLLLNITRFFRVSYWYGECNKWWQIIEYVLHIFDWFWTVNTLCIYQ